ncbi:sugar transferase [Sabulicella rubraurantiaca]|uniref:sugar transferase n=1 Tax=Sabulicella rubraurantiaca TaxID=2811429 RepID=UPI001A97BAE6|nr:sugar transferase [Sabulicella rubraurantiaca]
MTGLDAFSSLQRDTAALGAFAPPQAVQVSRGPGWRAVAKRGLDVLGAGALLLFLAPVFALLALLVRVDGGPAFFAHPRVGRNGQIFGCLKFRSMVVDSQARLAALLAADPAARAEWEETRKLRFDPRVTRIGRFLRATSLDELPQLLNVLRGDMSLVGPRPVQQAELDSYYGAAAFHYMSVRPGITGLWQVSGRSETSYAQRVALDVAYVSRPSLMADLRILLRTPLAVLSRKGAH